MIPWKLTKNFNEHIHLFSGLIETNYLIDAYICSCGEVEFLIKDTKQDLDFTCEHCGNSVFYDAKNTLTQASYLLNAGVEVSPSCEVQYDGVKICAAYSIQIPNNLNFSSGKILYISRNIYELSLDKEGVYKEVYLLKYDDAIKQSLTKLLVETTVDIMSFLPTIPSKELSLETVQFFFKNKHLKVFEFYYWSDSSFLDGESLSIEKALSQTRAKRYEKSLKKALYINYQYQIKNYKKFYGNFIRAFCRVIKDINILVALVNLKQRKVIYEGIYDYKIIYNFLVFLKEYYSEKQIYRYFELAANTAYYYLLKDSLNELSFNDRAINEYFIKVSCSPLALHNELIRCTDALRYEHISNKDLEYTKEELAVCISIMDYEVKLPLNGDELYTYAGELKNCMAGYFEDILIKNTIIYCFFKENNLEF